MRLDTPPIMGRNARTPFNHTHLATTFLISSSFSPLLAARNNRLFVGSITAKVYGTIPIVKTAASTLDVESPPLFHLR